MFGADDAMIRLDMSEFMERHSVARLVGAPPGYVGYEDGGQLTDTVRRKSYCLILLDEIEKAHPEVFNLLLQIFDDGHLTDAKGRKVDFRNTIIIMTSNVGAELIRRDSQFGFALKQDEAKTSEDRHKKMRDKVMAELKTIFRPEFLNRIDNTVVFHSLQKEHIRTIVDLMLTEVGKQVTLKGMSLDGHRRGEGLARREGVRPRVRGATAAPRHPERDRGSALRGSPRGAVRRRRRDDRRYRRWRASAAGHRANRGAGRGGGGSRRLNAAAGIVRNRRGRPSGLPLRRPSSACSQQRQKSSGRCRTRMLWMTPTPMSSDTSELPP